MADAVPTPDITADFSDGCADVDQLFTLLVETARLLSTKYPKKHGAFERVVHLAEETGEVAEQINIWAGTGLKRQKHGDFNPRNLAIEISDVMRVAVGIALEFDIVDLVGDEIRSRHSQSVRDSGSP